MFSSNTSQVSADANWIEECFSTHLYTGTGSTQTITNGIDLAGKGGMVWTKARSSAISNGVMDTARGTLKTLITNNTDAEDTYQTVTAFNANGFSVGTSGIANGTGSTTMCSWTFRKQAKFFDVVTYTGNGTARTISHSLGSVPGCIIVKRTDSAESWYVYHRSIGAGGRGILNLTDAFSTSGATNWNNTEPTSTQFSLGASSTVNANSGTYVAYLFAHDAGGFGLTGTDNVISCGSFTSDSGGNATVTLGYEPQWLLYKSSSSSDSWYIFDSMRKWTADGAVSQLIANSSAAEANSAALAPTATGFTSPALLAASTTYIYIAIRRGPMKTPTTGTSVFSPVARTGTGATAQITGIGFPPDLAIGKPRTGYAVGTAQFDRLRGTSVYLAPSWTDAEISDTTMVTSFNMDGISLGADTTQRYFNGPSGTYANWMFRRAPGFFDVVCYTGTGSNTTQTHNLGVVPELIIVKRRDTTGAWDTYSAALSNTEYLVVNTTAAKATGTTRWNSTTPTSSVFSLGTSTTVNASGGTYVAYLFATVSGVSKVGSYTGTGTTLQIDCGFTGGARFVLIKRTDSTGDWYVWDSARGIVSGNDPYLLLNSTDAEVTNTDYVDTYSAGFEISSTAPAAINANGGTFVFLAVA